MFLGTSCVSPVYFRLTAVIWSRGMMIEKKRKMVSDLAFFIYDLMSGAWKLCIS